MFIYVKINKCLLFNKLLQKDFLSMLICLIFPTPSNSMEDIEWNVVNEGQLLDAMVGHKPIGVNKYFQMALICDKLATNLRKDVDPQKIWAHLKTMYNLEALDENESIPFPNTEQEFSLPESEFGELLSSKEEENKKIATETPKVTKEPPAKKEVNNKNNKESTPRRDSKEGGKDKTPANVKKDLKKDLIEKGGKTGKGRNANTPKVEEKSTPKLVKRTRGSLKSNDDSGSSGKSSPVTVTPIVKRRRIV